MTELQIVWGNTGKEQTRLAAACVVQTRLAQDLEALPRRTRQQKRRGQNVDKQGKLKQRKGFSFIRTYPNHYSPNCPALAVKPGPYWPEDARLQR